MTNNYTAAARAAKDVSTNELDTRARGNGFGAGKKLVVGEVIDLKKATQKKAKPVQPKKAPKRVLPTENKTKPNPKRVKRAKQLAKRPGESVVVNVYHNGVDETQKVVVHVAPAGKGKNNNGKASVTLLDLKTGKDIEHKSAAGIDALEKAVKGFPKPERKTNAFSSKDPLDRNKVVQAALKNAQKAAGH
jgi:hypothetical protein